MGNDLIVPTEQKLPDPFEAFPVERRSGLDAFLRALPEQEQAEFATLWPQLPVLIDRVRSRRAEHSRASLFSDWPRDVLMQLLTRDRNWFRRVKEPAVQQTIERAHRLLELYVGAPVPKLVVRLFDPPVQRIGRHPEQDVPVAIQVEARFRSFLAEQASAREASAKSLAVQVGALMLALILDCGVLNRRELKAAIEMLYAGGRIRGARGSYYLFLALGHGGDDANAQTRRLFLTPLALSAAIVVKPSVEPLPSLGAALRAVLKCMGISAAGSPSLKVLLSGVGVLMRFSGPIPQFVVDFAEGRVDTHAMSESTWRRALNLAPWKQEDPQVVQAEGGDEAPDKGETKRAFRQDGSLFSRVMIVLSTACTTAEAQAALLALKDVDNGTNTERLLHEWAIALTRELCGTGKTRRIGTIRNMLNACGPRLIASVGDDQLSGISVDDWRGLVEQIADESISSSWRTTVYNALQHFLNWIVATGRLPELPVDVPAARPGSSVNPTLVTPREFRELLRRLDDELSSEPSVDRRYQKLIAILGYDIGLRRGESRGLLIGEVDWRAPMFAAVEPNRIRVLKTDSSPRRSPLGLQIREDAEAAIAEACRSPSADGRLLPADRISVDEETLLRRLSALLSEICGDPDVSIHSLRHSAATWILLCLYADILQLGRFQEQWPFVTELLEIAAEVRRTLFGNKSSLHGLHIVRQMLGHRHESMSLVHYIHALDLLRYAATTLRVGEANLDQCIGAVRLAQPMMTRSPDLSTFLRKLDRRFPGRLMLDDTARTQTPAQTLREATREHDVLKRWLVMSDRCAMSQEQAQGGLGEWHERIVDLINRRSVVNKAKNSSAGLSNLHDIRPTTTTDRGHAQRLAAWIDEERGHDTRFCDSLERILEAHAMRGQGWFSVKSRSIECSLDLMENIAARIGARLELAIERKKRKGLGKARRTFDPIPSMEVAIEMGRRSVFARFISLGDKESSCSHHTLTWCIAMGTLARPVT